MRHHAVINIRIAVTYSFCGIEGVIHGSSPVDHSKTPLHNIFLHIMRQGYFMLQAV
jgi:hypothetical protein